MKILSSTFLWPRRKNCAGLLTALLVTLVISWLVTESPWSLPSPLKCELLYRPVSKSPSWQLTIKRSLDARISTFREHNRTHSMCVCASRSQKSGQHQVSSSTAAYVFVCVHAHMCVCMCVRERERDWISSITRNSSLYSDWWTGKLLGSSWWPPRRWYCSVLLGTQPFSCGFWRPQPRSLCLASKHFSSLAAPTPVLRFPLKHWKSSK